jgi:integrase
MIYKRGCDKKGPHGTCSKCGDHGSCGVYWYKFMWQGRLIRESTHQSNDKVARSMESAHRTSLAKGEVGIREKKAAPILSEFLKRDFLPFCKTRHATKPATLRYYKTGAANLTESKLGPMPLDEINDQYAQQYAARLEGLSPSTINCGLRTLRRAIYLAAEWGTIDKRPRIRLVPGERQRDRVLTDAEVEVYLKACDQPWRDVATVMLGTGMRPGEVFALRWESILFKDDGGGFIQILQGKSKAARRVLPMVSAVRKAIETRWENHRRPEEGWLFPSSSACGHLDGNSSKNQHCLALRHINEEARKKSQRGLTPFPPYTLRHTALTHLGDTGCDAFTLARIAGHSSITITQRYVHPQADAIERAFSKLPAPNMPRGGHKNGHSGKPAQLKAAKKKAQTTVTPKD